ncbi:MAG TPA: 1,4-dihydroxy-2-naphthoate octaprenyltransferase [Syntrophorhabdaceae bacterium]|nr:1,4-dihydroxy-2-naphthoate octaprenyltransferase [Syntrophorhabdaceae bacterium]HPN99014.1 1,4-dihydroxy-2-naphthoate octaprenyltransferase [Syntrophorhabdaceae bacterium]HQI57085.1 1,4-dihydroxy-2-naphthoate octaprenyltransferase [Syntrophorhabdaceae bacterium]HQM77475.1 1,4-dihydroxy-2-naphthoate octaprenyltransferase [Syntrophorhabdaceae bacterium]
MSKVSIWWQASRPFSFTVSILPPILGSIIAKMESPGLKIDWLLFALALIGCVIAHAGANMIGDYFDFKKRVDREGTFGSSGVLISNLIEPKKVFMGSIVAYVIASSIGIYIAASIPNGMYLILIIIIGAVLGLFYAAEPFSFKYHALGDLAVFISFGPAMTLGAYFVQAHHFSWTPVLYAIPAAFLVDAVLHSNNLRDIKNDSVVNIKTVAILIGEQNSKRMYYGLIISAYISVILLITANGLPTVSLITLLSLPLALKLIRIVKHKNKVPDQQFIMIDAATAQLHSVFSVLFVVSLLVQHYFMS